MLSRGADNRPFFCIGAVDTCMLLLLWQRQLDTQEAARMAVLLGCSHLEVRTTGTVFC